MKNFTRKAALAISGAMVAFATIALVPKANAQVGGHIFVGGPGYGISVSSGPTWNDDGRWRGEREWRGDDAYYHPEGGWDNDAGAIVWHGRVDDRANIYFHGDQWSSEALTGKGIDDQHARIFQPLPFDREHVSLARVEGRGNVFVFQQPNRENGYTVGVRVYDPQAGRGDYRFSLVWN